MADRAEQLKLNEPLFDPQVAMRAMRDSRYRRESNAIAELIDNSVDARARRVELLLFEEQRQGNVNDVWRVGQLAVVDDGLGMDPRTLQQALRFGGRSDDGRIHRIGKYGVGLPTASASQCLRVDIWTWQEPTEQPWHCFLDIGAIERGEVSSIAPAERHPLDERVRRFVTSQGLRSNSGTVVLWSDIDRIKARPETIFGRLEREIGRIHRHRISDGRLTIHARAIRDGVVRPETDRSLRPNDPLFLMEDTATAPPWDHEPMFKPYGESMRYTVDVDGRMEHVEVRYSMVKREAIGNDPTQPGRRPHGKDAMENAGVSIVREERELLLDRSFVGAGARRDEPQHRWWGCEVRFDSGCDDLFGVDHNKQMASAFSDLAEEMARSDDADYVLREQLKEDHQLYEIVEDIRSTIRAMRGEINQMFGQRRAALQRSKTISPEKEAERRASLAVADQLESGATLTQTDRMREQTSPEVRIARFASFLQDRGVADPEDSAREHVEENIWFRFRSAELSGSQIFMVERSEGILVVVLNVHHPIHKFIQFLEQREDNQMAHQSAVAILTLILAWARMEDHIERTDDRRELQNIAIEWGKQVERILAQLVTELSAGDL